MVDSQWDLAADPRGFTSAVALFHPGVYSARIQYLNLTFPEVVVVCIFCYTVFQEKCLSFSFALIILFKNIVRIQSSAFRTRQLNMFCVAGDYRYRVQYSYKPRHADELELCAGDVVYVVETCADGWFIGTCERTQEFGTFPGNYVQRMRVVQRR